MTQAGQDFPLYRVLFWPASSFQSTEKLMAIAVRRLAGWTCASVQKKTPPKRIPRAKTDAAKCRRRIIKHQQWRPPKTNWR